MATADRDEGSYRDASTAVRTAAEEERDACLGRLGDYLRSCAESGPTAHEHFLNDARKCLEVMAHVWRLSLSGDDSRKIEETLAADRSTEVNLFVERCRKKGSSIHHPTATAAVEMIQKIGNAGSHVQFVKDFVPDESSRRLCGEALLVVIPWFFRSSGLVPTKVLPAEIQASLARIRAGLVASAAPVVLVDSIEPIVAPTASGPVAGPEPSRSSRRRWPWAVAALVGLGLAGIVSRRSLELYWTHVQGYPEVTGEWKWSDICLDHLKNDRPLLAESTCKQGLSVEGVKPIVQAALHYKLGMIADRRGQDVEALSTLTWALSLYPPEASRLRGVAEQDNQRLCLKAGAPPLLPGDSRRLMALTYTKPDGGTIRAEKSTRSAVLGVLHAPACVLAGSSERSPEDLWYPVEARVDGKTITGWMVSGLLEPRKPRR